MKKSYSTLLLCVLLCGTAAAQDDEVTGQVTSASSGEPLPGVNVVVQGTTSGTATGPEGRYALTVSAEADTLTFSYIGFQTQKAAIEGRGVIDVALEENVSQLSQMVVVGHGQQEKETLTSSISSVSTKDIENLPGTSANSLIQGRAAGVQVSNDSGEPGGGLFIRVRGSTSISGGSDPLYVVDGVPVEATNLSAFDLGGATTNPIAGINPSNIASIEVLKDASATAIYGARAANGVVLITTKRGSNAAPTISFNTYAGIQSAPRTPKLVDGPTFERLQNEAYLNNGGDPSEMPYPNPEEAMTTEWADYVFRDAPIQNYDLSVRGGTSNIQYFVSGNYMAQEGILDPTAFDRASGRVNLDFDASDKLHFGTSIEYSNTNRNRAENNDNISGELGGVYFFPANVPVYDDDGGYYKFSIFENPVAIVNESDIAMTDEHLLGNAYATYDFMPGLNLKTSWSLDNHYVADESYYSTLLNEGAATNGSGTLINSNYSRWVNENLLSYKTNFGGHMIDALLGTSLEELSFEQTEANGEQFPSNDFRRITSAAVQTSSSDGFKRGLASVFGRLQYDYRGKYLGTVTVRRDGSSRFGEKNQWGTFPSLALGWVVSEEPFMDGLQSLSNLKLRASYGITGNQSSIDNFQARGLWTGGANYVDLPGTEPAQLANPDLKWESTAQLDLGVDLSLFNDRVTVTYDYYDKQTDDLLLAVPVPRTTGFSTVVQNFGELSNKGMEFSLSAALIQRDAFTWNADFNIAGNRNKIKTLATPLTSIIGTSSGTKRAFPCTRSGCTSSWASTRRPARRSGKTPTATQRQIPARRRARSWAIRSRRSSED